MLYLCKILISLKFLWCNSFDFFERKICGAHKPKYRLIVVPRAPEKHSSKNPLNVAVAAEPDRAQGNLAIISQLLGRASERVVFDSARSEERRGGKGVCVPVGLVGGAMTIINIRK